MSFAPLRAELKEANERIAELEASRKDAMRAAWDAAIDEMIIGTAVGHTFETWYRANYEGEFDNEK